MFRKPGRCPGVWGLMALASVHLLSAGEFRLTPAAPTLDRWVYPYGDFSGDRPVAPTFASFDPRFDTRDAQFLLGWDTAPALPSGSGAANYLIRRVRLTLTIQADRAFEYDPTHDSYLTYQTNHPGYVPDADPGRPVELFGAGYRNGFTAASFTETSPNGPLNPISSGNISIGTRNAFAAVHGPDGALLDIANNVGQANPGWTNAPFEVRSWAVGQTTNVAAGELVPSDARVTFDVDLSDPLVTGYLQSALNDGRLRLFLSSLSPAAQITPGGIGGGGGGAYPQWATKENLLYDGPALEIEGSVVTPVDTDDDGLPDDWEKFYLRNLDAGAGEDSDRDGMTNADEWVAGTDPDNAASLLRILSAEYDSEGNARLRFPVAPSRSYRVEFGGQPGGWISAQGELTFPEPGIAEFHELKQTDPPFGPPAAFYRVVIAPPAP